MVNRVPEVLAIIPARGGSKGLPGKNVYEFAGFPLISYSIAAALQAKSVTRVIVSTDDDEIAAVAREYGAEVPFMRPDEISGDHSLDIETFEHALRWLADNEHYYPDYVVQLRPTSPLRPPQLIDECVALMQQHPEAESVRGVVPAGQNPYKMWLMEEDTDFMHPLITADGLDESYNAPRQKLPQAFWQTGHIDVIRPDVILEKKQMSGWPILAYHIDPRYTVDIDNLETLLKAEQLVWAAEFPIVHPAGPRRPFPKKISLLALDFDGTMTDDRVWVREDGIETVAANRGDGMGIGLLKKAGVKVIVISKETNPVVTARCSKLNIPVVQGVDDKPTVLQRYLEDHGIPPDEVIYLGNDINDVPVFPVVAYGVVVADAHLQARNKADRILTKNGGYGAVRELCDLILEKQQS
ncbi:MAG: acylneuraminate cytidylyltransferase [Anaerolineae bacterium]|jgi:N-acylneuraminate cytidylyltransferase|nr:acylneuraminate cytidylyltransferase [Anaerolineae bacterium]